MFYWTKHLNLFHNKYINQNIFIAEDADLLANFSWLSLTIPTGDFFEGNTNHTMLQQVKYWKYVTKMQLNVV